MGSSQSRESREQRREDDRQWRLGQVRAALAAELPPRPTTPFLRSRESSPTEHLQNIRQTPYFQWFHREEALRMTRQTLEQTITRGENMSPASGHYSRPPSPTTVQFRIQNIEITRVMLSRTIPPDELDYSQGPSPVSSSPVTPVSSRPSQSIEFDCFPFSYDIKYVGSPKYPLLWQNSHKKKRLGEIRSDSLARKIERSLRESEHRWKTVGKSVETFYQPVSTIVISNDIEATVATSSRTTTTSHASVSDRNVHPKQVTKSENSVGLLESESVEAKVSVVSLTKRKKSKSFLISCCPNVFLRCFGHGKRKEEDQESSQGSESGVPRRSFLRRRSNKVAPA